MAFNSKSVIITKTLQSLKLMLTLKNHRKWNHLVHRLEEGEPKLHQPKLHPKELIKDQKEAQSQGNKSLLLVVRSLQSLESTKIFLNFLLTLLIYKKFPTNQS